MRFVGQGSEIEVPVPAVETEWHDAVRRNFAEQYEERFGTVAPQGVEIEILTWRLASRGPEPDAHLVLPSAESADDASLGTHDAYFSQTQGYVDTAVYDRYRIRPDAVIEGPALIQERESTLLLAPGMRCTVAADGSVLVKLQTDERAP